MKNNRVPLVGKALAALFVICMFAATSAWATVVTWQLNPTGTTGAVGSSSHTFTSSGYDLTASGYTVGTPNTPLGLFYRNDGSDEIGLGVVDTSHNELQASGGMPLQFIQLDLTSLLNQGFTDGKIKVGSVQPGEEFALYASNTMGVLGTQIGTFDSSSDVIFLDVPNFGSFNFLSVGATIADVLPVAFRASLAPVPEMSALFPIIGLILAVSLTQLLRRRRLAHSRSGSR